MKMKDKFLTLAAFAMAANSEFAQYDEPERLPIPVKLPRKPPKGAKEYFFNERGEFSTERMLKTDVVFKCYAVNDKNAIRKFKKYKS